MNTWIVSCYFDGESWRGRLVDKEYGGVIDVDHLHDDWTVRDYDLRSEADREAVWKYGTYEALCEAAVRRWLKISYLSWNGGSVLKIDGKTAAAVEAS